MSRRCNILHSPPSRQRDGTRWIADGVCNFASKSLTGKIHELIYIWHLAGFIRRRRGDLILTMRLRPLLVSCVHRMVVIPSVMLRDRPGWSSSVSLGGASPSFSRSRRM